MKTVLAPLLAPADPRRAASCPGSSSTSLVAVAYSIAGLVVVLFGIGPAKISPIYPPAGIAVAATFILGPRILPAVFVGQFLNGFPLLDDARHDAVDVRARQHRHRHRLDPGGADRGRACCGVSPARGIRSTGARHVVIFLLGSCLAAALVCGAIGTFSLWAGGFVPDDEVEITFVTFFLADAAGIAVFGALVLAWYREPRLDREIVTSSALIVGRRCF